MRSRSSSLQSRGIFLVVTVALLLCSSTAFAQVGYYDPGWAPDWFKQCPNLKQWASWDFSQGTGYSEWHKNYPDPQEPPVLSTSGQTTREVIDGRLRFLNETTATRSAVFNVWMDNVPRPDYWKDVWFQFDIISPSLTLEDVRSSLSWGYGPGTGMPTTYQLLPNEDFVIDMIQGPTGESKFRVTAYHQIFPQPDWERIFWNIDKINPGQAVFIDDVKMATQCNPVPEPATMVLTAMGLSAIGAYRRKRR